MHLPPLRTVRDLGSVPSAASSPADSTPAMPQGPAVPATGGLAQQPALRRLLHEAIAADLIDPLQGEEFLAQQGAKLRDISRPDQAAAALIHHGLLTPFQAERLLAGNTFGLVIGNYRILDRIAAGTVGIVFRAVHKILKRNVAIKAIPDDASTPKQFLERFELEMDLLARVDHPHVVRIYDTGVLPSAAAGVMPLRYAVLELVDGCDLEQFIYQHGVLSVALTCKLGRQLAGGLAAMHAHNLVHRDFKPSNVLLSRNFEAKVSDFGLTRHFASTATPRPGIVGSVEFMAPEQASDPCTAGPPADIYALGATLLWTLTGQLPFPAASSTREALHLIRTATPRRLRDLQPELPEPLDQMLTRMMSRDPSRRPTAAEACGWFGAFASACQRDPANPTAPAELSAEVDLLRFAVDHLEQTVAVREQQLMEASATVLHALARVVQVHGESAGQQRRMREYVRVLADYLKRKPDWTMLADPRYVADLLDAVPVRNIGYIGLPDHLFTVPLPRSAADQAMWERHPVIGCSLFDAAMARHGQALSFARLARDIIRSHHECWDGSGYPDRLCKEKIPPAARLVALAEAYDALRAAQPSQPGLPHQSAIQQLLEQERNHHDPVVLDALLAGHDAFASIFASIPD